MSWWRKRTPDPPWLTGVPAEKVDWPPEHAGRKQSLFYDPKGDDSLELNVMVTWYRACMDGRVKLGNGEANSNQKPPERGKVLGDLLTANPEAAPAGATA